MRCHSFTGNYDMSSQGAASGHLCMGGSLVAQKERDLASMVMWMKEARQHNTEVGGMAEGKQSWRGRKEEARTSHLPYGRGRQRPEMTPQSFLTAHSFEQSGHLCYWKQISKRFILYKQWSCFEPPDNPFNALHKITHYVTVHKLHRTLFFHV